MSIFVSILLALVWSLALPVPSQAEVVGRFQQVAGPVDLFKQGKPRNPHQIQGPGPGKIRGRFGADHCPKKPGGR